MSDQETHSAKAEAAKKSAELSIAGGMMAILFSPCYTNRGRAYRPVMQVVIAGVLLLIWIWSN